MSASQKTTEFRLTHTASIDPEGWDGDTCLVLPNWLCLCKWLVYFSIDQPSLNEWSELSIWQHFYHLSHCPPTPFVEFNADDFPFFPKNPPLIRFYLIHYRPLQPLCVLKQTSHSGLTGGFTVGWWQKPIFVNSLHTILSITQTYIAIDPSNKLSQCAALSMLELSALLVFLWIITLCYGHIRAEMWVMRVN